ncbi:hypothetical protein Plhal703r1_c07g0040171 [Plasmopara halstedii]
MSKQSEKILVNLHGIATVANACANVVSTPSLIEFVSLSCAMSTRCKLTVIGCELKTWVIRRRTQSHLRITCDALAGKRAHLWTS